MTEPAARTVLVLDDEADRRQIYIDLLLAELQHLTGVPHRSESVRRLSDAHQRLTRRSPTPSVVIIDHFWRESDEGAGGDGPVDDELVEAGPALVELARSAFGPDTVIVALTRQRGASSFIGACQVAGADYVFFWREFIGDVRNMADLIANRRTHSAVPLASDVISAEPAGRFFRIESSTKVSCEVLVTDIVGSSTPDAETQVRRLSELATALEDSCRDVPDGQQLHWQFTGDGVIIALPISTPGLAHRIGAALHAAIAEAAFDVRTIVHHGLAVHLKFDDGRSEVVGYAVNEACHALAAVPEPDLVATGTYWRSVLAGGRELTTPGSFEEEEVVTKNGSRVPIVRLA